MLFRSEVALSDAAGYLGLPNHWGLTKPSGAVGGAHAGYRIYACKDGRVAVAALEPHFAQSLCEQAGVGSAGSVVARELSFVSVKLVEVMVIAFAKLSFAGGGAITTKVCGAENLLPGWLATWMSLVLPKGPRSDLSREATSCVAVCDVMVTPALEPLKVTWDVLEKPEPVSVTLMLFAGGICTGVDVGVMLVNVGVLPRTTNGKELVVLAPS